MSRMDPEPVLNSTLPYQDQRIDVLLVEDNQDHAGLIIHGLQQHSPRRSVMHLKDGEAALQYLRSTSSLPAIVLLDLRLPKIDGLDVLNAIKTDERLWHLPVVILTTSESEKDIARAYSQHVNSYLVKPVDFELFKTLMKDLGVYWLEYNRPRNPL